MHNVVSELEQRFPNQGQAEVAELDDFQSRVCGHCFAKGVGVSTRDPRSSNINRLDHFLLLSLSLEEKHLRGGGQEDWGRISAKRIVIVPFFCLYPNQVTEPTLSEFGGPSHVCVFWSQAWATRKREDSGSS